jgi:mitochondrial chaperone BCS1
MHTKALDYFVLGLPFLVSTGMVGGIIGAFYYYLDRLYRWTSKKMYCTMTIKYNDDAFKWVLKFMQDKGFNAGSGTLKVQIKEDGGEWYDRMFQSADDRKKPEIEYVTGSGAHLMNFKGYNIIAKKDILEKINTGHDNQPTDIEELKLYVRGSDPGILKDFINAAIDHIFKEDGDKIGMYVIHTWGFWTKASTKKARKMESVILDDGIAENMMADMRRFLDSAKWYAEKGVPYRRGYLLYGPPGTGKSSFTQAIAG